MTNVPQAASAVDIRGIDKAELLAALHNHSMPMGMGILQARGDLTADEARTLIEQAAGGKASDDHGRMFDLKSKGSLYFDYLYGRPLKVDISGDEISPLGFDRDNGGPGTLAAIVARLRKAGGAR